MSSAFSIWTGEGFKFITMEFVEGRDLRAVLRERGKLPPEETVRIIAQVCRALEADTPPVWSTRSEASKHHAGREGSRYVMDFGIAHSSKHRA